jgi:hypothetical protein
MAIVGFSFTKVHAEKTGTAKGKVNISNNVKVANIEDANLSMGESKKGLKVDFEFTSAYEPKFGAINLDGSVILLEDVKPAEEILKNWEKDKALPKELMPPVLNHILERCNVQALLMARDLGLPAPIPLPKVNVQQAGDKKK